MDLKQSSFFWKKISILRGVLFCIFQLLLSISAFGLELSHPFYSNMVLQRDEAIPLTGTAHPSAEITVKFANKNYNTRADKAGKWKVSLLAQKANATPQSLRVETASKLIVLENLLIGDVWLASGQSNMAWSLRQSADAKKEISGAKNPLLRFLNHQGKLYPGGQQYNLNFLKQMIREGYYYTPGWQECIPSNAPNQSAVAYHFANHLTKKLNVPIGVIQLAVGGSPIEAHIPVETLKKNAYLSFLEKKPHAWMTHPHYPRWCQQRAKHNVQSWLKSPAHKNEIPPHPYSPGFLWKEGIQPLKHFPIKGVIWYQGESNAGKDGTPEAIVSGKRNKKKFGQLVQSLRKHWKQQLPVYYVQLPGLNRQWVMFREWQLQASQEMKNVGMAISIDHGHPTDVHPRNKKPIGARLARLALAKTYQQSIVPNGPLFKSHQRVGNTIVLQFHHDAGLKLLPESRGFEIAGKDKVFHPATAKVHKNRLIISGKKVKKPLAVRYAWDNDPVSSFTNSTGIPASPFRTDNWKHTQPTGQSSKKKTTAMNNSIIRVACIGDSITFGYGLKDKTYPNYLQKLLGNQYLVKNFGNSGRGIVLKSMRGHQKRAYFYMKEHQQALRFQPHIVICNLGINDCMDWNKGGKETFVDDYSLLIKTYQSLPTQPKILIWNKLAPLFPGQAFFNKAEPKEINAHLTVVAKKNKVLTIDMASPFSKNDAKLFPDHIHPNAEGASIIAKTVHKALLKINQ